MAELRAVPPKLVLHGPLLDTYSLSRLGALRTLDTVTLCIQ